MADNVVKDVVESQGLSLSKPYGVTLIACNHTNGVIDQIIPITEYAATADEQVYKYQWLCDAVIQALNGKNEAGTGGALREMGEGFQLLYEATGGDMEKMMEEYTKARKAAGQGKPVLPPPTAGKK